MTTGQLMVWLLVGALAGSIIGRLVTFRKEGLGFWVNLAMGMVGAVLGGFLFRALGIDFGVLEMTVTLTDFVAACVGTLLCFLGAWGVNKKFPGKSQTPAD